MIYDVSHKTLISAKPLRIMFDNVNEFIRDYDGIKYLVLFNVELYDAIYDRMRYLIIFKSGISCVVSYNFGKIKIDS